MADRTPRTIHDGGGNGAGVGNPGPAVEPEQSPDSTHDGAPAGPSIASDLPSIAVPGGMPMVLTGYAPQRDQDALPAPGSADGNGVAPDGLRR